MTKYIKLLVFTILSIVLYNTEALSSTGAGTDSITQAICNLNGFITSGPGKAVVLLVILSTGFGMFFGKITWVTAIIILVGVGLTFGAPTIVGQVAGGDFKCVAKGSITQGQA